MCAFEIQHDRTIKIVPCRGSKNKRLFPSALSQIYLVGCSCQSLGVGILTLDILSYRNENNFMFLIFFL